jgi:hypothetical protein
LYRLYFSSMNASLIRTPHFPPKIKPTWLALFWESCDDLLSVFLVFVLVALKALDVN